MILPAAALGALLLAVLASDPAEAQRKSRWSKDAAWRVDPYSGNEDEALAKAGYVSFGPFDFADDYDTSSLEQMLGKEQIRWVETKHFKIGSALAGWRLPGDKKTRKKIRRELKLLKRKLPRVPTKVKKLDPWLRLHLLAQRCEEVYADMSKRLGVTDEDFTSETSQRDGLVRGPYFGQPSKFLILVLTNESNLSRCLSGLIGTESRFPKRHYFAKTGSLFFATAVEHNPAFLGHDTGMHCHVVWNLVHMLVNGYRSYTFVMPVWFGEGLAHWYARRIDPRFNNLGQDKEYQADAKKYDDWARKVRARVKFDYFTPMAKMLRWVNYDAFKFDDHMMAWSRIDYLMSLGDEKLRVFLNTMKSRFYPEGSAPGLEQVLAQQEKALELAFGTDADGLDRLWKAYVLRVYPKK
ncbi:MAG: hypothetical protein ACE5F1_12110 [Planctomycetota bacterium]